jgi:5-methylcytosine-specific restriction enzyme B
MTIATLNTEQINKLIEFVNEVFPDWQGFSDPRFEKAEVSYKQKAFQKAKALLKESDLLDLIVQGNFDEFIDRLTKMGRSTNLLYQAVPMQGDLNVLFQENLDKPAFCRAFMDLIYGSGSTPERLEKYSSFLRENRLPNRWTFPTYFLFACHPVSEMFVKPTTTQWFVQFSGMVDPFPSSPSGEIYGQLLELCKQLWDGLQKYQPRDFVDIQGFIWAASSANQRKNKLSKPFNKMFKDWQEAQWAFDLLQTAAEHLGIQKPDDILVSVTNPNGLEIRLTYGIWWVLGIKTKANTIRSILVTLYKDKIKLPWIYEGDFKTTVTEPPTTLYELSVKDFKENQEQIMEVFAETMHFVSKRFGEWKANPHHQANIEKLLSAIINPDLRDEILTKGISVEKGTGEEDPEGIVHYWKIAPGENAWNWEACKNGGFISIGWEETGDISEINREEFDNRCKTLLEQHSDWGPKGIEQVWDFGHIQTGDLIVANRGTKEVIGIGTVIGPYTFVPDITHGHHLPVRWDDTQSRPVKKGHWVRTIIELNQKEYKEILQIPPVAQVIPSDQLFDETTFQLLEQLHNNPTQAFYNEHKQEFKNKVEQPFQSLMQQTADLLRPEILELMETEKNLFSRFNKNDFGKMGVWDFYWGAYYPKGGKRTNDPQLSLWINYERLEIGFYIGNYGETARARFRKNCQENVEKLIQWLSEIVSDSSLLIGSHHDITIKPDGSILANNKITWKDWLSDPEKSDYDLSLILPKEQLLQFSSDQLIETAVGIYNRFFPFIILATSDNPLPVIAEYLGIQDKPEIQPIYSLEQCSEETGIDLIELEKWIKAIERKKQVILYGPPGTGKTFIAEKLAKNLIGGGDGFDKLMQFHPEVSYEDFIQGIRPKSLPNGGLYYPVVPGRFTEFCDKASSREGTCVLIIDEINRANLARVFGELMYLLEYRDKEVELAAGNHFKIPTNVRIIGTMNTADRSIALVDHALRRRFAFLPLYPNYNILKRYHERENTGFAVDGLISVLEELNKQIADRHYTIGTSYFLRNDIKSQIAHIWQMEIEPYLEEYFFDQPEKYQRFCWDKVTPKIMG